MASERRREWSRLGERQRKRYLGAGRKQGLSESQVREHYESGGALTAWRLGPKAAARQQRTGISERQWRTLMAAARKSRLGYDGDHPENSVPPDVVLESLLQKGFTPSWILGQLERQAAVRAQAAKGKQGPGNKRWFGRKGRADIELYYYH